MSRLTANAIVATTIAACSFVTTAAPWYESPMVKAKVDAGYSNTDPHFMNLSEDGAYLMLDTHSSQDAKPCQLYRVSDLKSLSGTVGKRCLGEAFGKDLFGTTASSAGNGWKGGAISSALGLMIPGNGTSDDARYTSLKVPASSWTANESAFQLSGFATTDLGAVRASDGLDFNASGTRLYANCRGQNATVFVYDTTALKSDHAVTLLETVDMSAKNASVTRIRNLSCYSIDGQDLVYFGEGGIEDGAASSVYVYSPADGKLLTLVTDSSIASDVMNVKVSGVAAGSPLLYVQTEKNGIFVYSLAADGKALASTTAVATLSVNTVATLCGLSAVPSEVKFRSFEVTDDGQTAFFCARADGAEAYLTVVGSFAAAYPAADDTPSDVIEWMDYLDSTGLCYIDTGIVGKDGTRCEAKMQWLEVGNDVSFLDARKDSGDTRFLMIHTNGGKVGYGYGKYANPTVGGSMVSLSANRDYTVAADFRAGSQKIWLDGTQILNETKTGPIDTGANLYLFACNFAERTAEAQWPCKARVYSLKIWQDDANGVERLVRDFVPCIGLVSAENQRRGVAALYDRISGKVFCPHSTTRAEAPIWEYLDKAPSFLAGKVVSGKPDAYLEWIASDGNQFFDTGVKGQPGLTIKSKMMWRSLGADEYTYLGAYDSARYYALHAAKPSGSSEYDFWVAYGNTDGNRGYCTSGGSNVKVETGKTYDFELDASNASSVTYKLNGATVFTPAKSDTSLDSGSTLTLFAVQRKQRKHFVYGASVRCYSLSIAKDGTLIRDFKPCLKDGRAALYDAVNDEIYFPHGTLPYVAQGPVTNANALTFDHYIEYVDVSGSQYIDTGVIGKSGTRVKADMAWLSTVSVDKGFIGSRTDSGDTRFYPWHCSWDNGAFAHKKFCGVNQGYKSIPLKADTRLVADVGLESEKPTVKINGVKVYDTYLDSGSKGELDTGLNMYLFGENVAGAADNLSQSRLYRTKIWQGGKLVRDFAPIMTKEGVPAVYDLVSKAIFPLQATSAENCKFVGWGERVSLPEGLLIIFR